MYVSGMGMCMYGWSAGASLPNQKRVPASLEGKLPVVDAGDQFRSSRKSSLHT